MDKESLLKIARAACDAAVSGGAEFADVSAGFGRSQSVDLEKNAIKSCDARHGGHVSVRAICKGGTGWSGTDKATLEAAVEAGRNAARLAKLAEPDPDFICLPGPADSYPTVEGLFDPRIAEIEIKQLIKSALANVDGARAVCSDATVQGGVSSWSGSHALVNSLGVSLASDGSNIGGYIMAVVRRGDDVGSFYDFDFGRVLDDFDPEGIGASAAREAMKFLGARKIDTQRMPIILGPLASNSIFDSVVDNADAEGIQRGRSFMIGKLGQKIGSDALTLTDEPHIARGMSSRRWDSEGFPTKPLVVMENGVLKSYLYGSYTAGKAGVANTGHGTRGGGASSSNVIPKLGTMTSAEIIRSTKEGLYINMGGIHPNGVTGDVSISVDFGFVIKNGELAYPVMNAMVGGSFLDMLANVDQISSDYRAEPGRIMPTVRILDCLVAGGK
jgi:PmbA protein